MTSYKLSRSAKKAMSQIRDSHRLSSRKAADAISDKLGIDRKKILIDTIYGTRIGYRIIGDSACYSTTI